MSFNNKLISTGLFLSCVLLFGGCLDWFDSNSKDADSANKDASKPEIDINETRKKEIETEISNLNVDLDKLKNRRTKLIRKIKRYGADVEIAQNGLNEAKVFCDIPKNKKTSNCMEFFELQQNIDTKSTELDNQSTELGTLSKRLPPTITPTPTPLETSKGSIFSEISLLQFLLYLIGGFILLVSLGVLIYGVYSFVKNRRDAERGKIQSEFNAVRSDYRDLSSKYSELKKTIKIHSEQYVQIQSQIKQLKEHSSQVSKQNAVERDYTTPVPYQPEPKFPVSVEDYRNKNRNGIQQEATANPIGGTLTSDLSNGNEFIIVKDSELERGLFYAIPNQKRFASRSEYSNYQNYYDFDNPSGGEIWIRKLATVRQIEGGWKLYDKGKIEVR